METPHSAHQSALAVSSTVQFIKTIHEEQEKTMELMCDIIYSNSLFFENKAELNKTLTDNLRKKFCFSEQGSFVADSIDANFNDSGKILEEIIISIIREYAEQVNEITALTVKILETLEEHVATDSLLIDKVFSLIFHSFKASMRLIVHNTSQIINSCTRFVNLGFDFNEKVAVNYSEQLALSRNEHQNNMADFSGWVSEWWKQNEKGAA
jgi:hypothetical protein